MKCRDKFCNIKYQNWSLNLKNIDLIVKYVKGTVSPDFLNVFLVALKTPPGPQRKISRNRFLLCIWAQVEFLDEMVENLVSLSL